MQPTKKIESLPLIKIIVEYDGAVTINNEYTAVITSARPLIINWFADIDLFVETEFEKITVNTADSIHIVRPNAHKNLTVFASEQHTIFKNTVTLELAKGDNVFFLTIRDDKDRLAYKLPNSLFQ